jgi:hypothetical protein
MNQSRWRTTGLPPAKTTRPSPIGCGRGTVWRVARSNWTLADYLESNAGEMVPFPGAPGVHKLH